MLSNKKSRGKWSRMSGTVCSSLRMMSMTWCGNVDGNIRGSRIAHHNEAVLPRMCWADLWLDLLSVGYLLLTWLFISGIQWDKQGKDEEWNRLDDITAQIGISVFCIFICSVCFASIPVHNVCFHTSCSVSVHHVPFLYIMFRFRTSCSVSVGVVQSHADSARVR